MRTLTFLRLSLILFSTLLYGEIAQSPDFDPAALRSNWWSQFLETPGSLADKVSRLQSQIETVLPNMTESKQEEAKELIEKTKLNLKTFLNVQTSPPINFPQATPLSDSYPIEETLDIARTARSEAVELKSLKEEKEDRSSLIDSQQEILDQLTTAYFKDGSRSEDRFILGLKLVNAQIALYTSKLDLDRINRGIQGYEKFLKLNQEEINVAQTRLMSSFEEVQRLEKARETAYQNWQDSIKELAKKEKEQATLASTSNNDTGSGKTQQFNQELMQVNVTELLAHQVYLQLQIKLALARLIYNPQDTDPAELSRDIKDWRKQLNALSKKSEELSGIAKRQVQRSGQLLSLTSDNLNPSISEPHQQILKLAQNNLLALQRLDSEIEDSSFLETQVETRTASRIGGTKLFFNDTKDFVKSAWKSVSDWIESPLFHFGNLPISLSTLLKFLVAILATFWGSKKITDSFSNIASTRKSIDKSVLYRITRLAYYCLLTIGFLISLAVVGFDFSSFLLIAGALGVGLGFGLQTIFNNFMSGLILLFESHIKVGDYVEIASGVRGEVKEINVRSTIIALGNGVDVIVPNAEMISTKVTNWTLSHPYHRLKIPFTVSYGADKDLVRKLVSEAALKVPDTLIKPGFSDPVVFLTAFGPSGLDFELSVWLNEKHSRLPGKSLSDYLWAIEEALKINKIDIPFPRTDIRML